MAIVHFVNYKRGTQSRAAMRGVMRYVMQEKETAWDGVPLVSGINCQPKSVYDDFLNTKLRAFLRKRFYPPPAAQLQRGTSPPLRNPQLSEGTKEIIPER